MVKKYRNLSAAEQKLIDDFARAETNKKSLRELADDADYEMKYAEAYVDAYQALSERGVGLLGKHNSTFRSLKELQHKVKTKEDLEQAKQKQFGEELYAGYQNLKHEAYRKVITKISQIACRCFLELIVGSVVLVSEKLFSDILN